MGAPGVEVRPLRQMNGDAHFSEVFLDGAVVADADRICDVGAGWNVTRTALANERGALGAAGGRHRRADRPAAHDGPRTAPRAVRPPTPCCATGRSASTSTSSRRGSRPAAPATPLGPAGTPGPEGSGSKLRGSATMKSAAGFALAALGADAMLAGGEWQTYFLTAPSISIRGGTDEIQRNIVGERVLGLPPEPHVDVDRPWSEIPH